ncbi:hypothetical protein ACHAW5_003626 [Stephanodiscus triporus]|uniref:S-adenosylmethionine-dependent methyltransferase domain-containing protein n=1 Tax=Stephanodiscus triporus TaxID=2934178 RepID=A0ABD3QXN5_9STRA
MAALERDPNKFVSSSGDSREVSVNGRRVDARKGPSKRTRAKVDRPKQEYVYASQRRAMMESNAAAGKGRKGSSSSSSLSSSSSSSSSSVAGVRRRPRYDDNDDDYDDDREEIDMDRGGGSETTPVSSSSRPVVATQKRLVASASQVERRTRALEYARSVGLDVARCARCDRVVGDGPEELPRVVARVRVDGGGDDGGGGDGEITSGTYAYVLYKPAGWGILGERGKGGRDDATATTTTTTTGRRVDGDGGASAERTTTQSSTVRGKTRRVKAYDEEVDDYTYVEYDEEDVLALLTPQERLELSKEGGLKLSDEMAENARGALLVGKDDDHDVGSVARRRRRGESGKNVVVDDGHGDITPAAPTSRASLNIPSASRPSLANWLKALRASEGAPVRGGRYWVAIAGASEIDDSGLVLLCPRDRTAAIRVDACSYVAVIGNDGRLASRSGLIRSMRDATVSGVETSDVSGARLEVMSRIRTGRAADPVTTVRLSFSDGASTCDSAVLVCQDRLGDGVRGDASGDPFDRRSSRRLVHCESMNVSGLVDQDDVGPVSVEGHAALPDDVSNYAHRRDGSMFVGGGFLGRRGGLSRNGLTNAYREINGAADGYPGWFVDRYDKWLYVQQREEGGEVGETRPTASSSTTMCRGPLPSLHDGYTAGVYYLPIQADRSTMGAERRTPVLLEGKAAPDFVPVVENGIRYLVNLGDSFSTGIFLDQRLQRAWLADICNEETRVLNCFAHAGAFSVAAATSGARTVSLDLDKKWLDRVRPQMEANGIMEWEGRHDIIYGDCFDWLARLARRNELFDVVILDPPSTSVGKKKKRWSVKSDMAELVTLAAPLVKSGGLLFTTTNSASLRAEKFVNMCKKGLMDAGIPNARLERVSPMPSDFTSIGSQPVKNLVWRIP